MVARVVVTGMGIVSCMGNNQGEVLRSLQEGTSGLQYVPEMQELGFRVPVAGLVKGLDVSAIGKRSLRTMSEGAQYAAVAADEALQDAGLSLEDLRGTRVGVVVGSGAGGMNEAVDVEMSLSRYKNASKLAPSAVGKIMNSNAALSLATWLGIRGRCYSVSSACCTGTDSIGHGFELIRHGLLDVCICGGAEESNWGGWGFFAAGFSGPGQATPFRCDEEPASACRPYDRDRPGMVIVSEGGGILVLESLEHAAARGVPGYAEVIGYGSAICNT